MSLRICRGIAATVVAIAIALLLNVTLPATHGRTAGVQAAAAETAEVDTLGWG